MSGPAPTPPAIGFAPFVWSKQEFSFVSADPDRLVLDFVMQPGCFAGEHLHLDAKETFHITEGEIWLRVDGRPVVAKAGDVVPVERGVPHALRNRTNRPGKARVEYAPCSDLLTIYQILSRLAPDTPNALVAGLKLFYLVEHAGLHPWVTVRPRFLNRPLTWLLQLWGNLCGWDKSLEKYLRPVST